MRIKKVIIGGNDKNVTLDESSNQPLPLISKEEYEEMMKKKKETSKEKDKDKK